MKLLEIIERENPVNGFNHKLDTAEELVNWKIDVKKLSIIQDREVDIETIIKRSTDMENKIKVLKYIIIRGSEGEERMKRCNVWRENGWETSRSDV